MADLGTMYASLGLRLKGLAQTQRAFSGALTSMSKEIQALKVKLEELGVLIPATTTGKVVPALEKIPKAVIPAKKSLEDMTTSIFRSAQRWRTVGYLTSIVLTAPMIMAGKAAMQTANDFNFSMAKVIGLVGLAKDSVAGFKKEILTMAVETAQAPQALADAFYYITSAGFKRGEEAMRILETSAKAATAGLGEAADIAKLLVFTLNAYKKQSLDATRVADIFTAAVREGAIEAEGFAGAIQSVIPIASAMGLGIEQVAGSMAAMSLQGATAANAAVYLKGMLNALLKIKPGSIAAKALKQFGVTAEDLYATLKKPGGLLQVLVQLQELSGRTTGNIFLKEIFRDIRAMTGALSLAGENLEYNEFVMREVAKAAGDMGYAYDVVQQEMKVRMDRVKAVLDAVKISFGETLSKTAVPLWEKLANSLKYAVDWFNRLDEGTRKTIISVLALVAAIGPLALLGSVLKYAYGGLLLTLGKGFKYIWTIVGGLRGDLVKMNTAMAQSTRATSFFKKLAAGLLNVRSGLSLGKVLTTAPIIAMGTAIVGGAIALGKYAKKIKEVAKENDAFNKTVISVEGSMTKLKDLLQTDIEAMSVDELVTARTDLNEKMNEELDLIVQLEQNKKMMFQSDRLNNKLIREHTTHYKTMMDTYKALGVQIDLIAERFTAERKAADATVIAERNKKTKEYNEELKELWDNMMAQLRAVDEMAKVNEKLGKSYNIPQEKAEIMLNTLEELTGPKWKFSFEAEKVQTLMSWLKELGIDFSKVDNIVEDFNAELAAIDMKKLLLGPDFDANTAKLQAYEKQIDRLVEELLKKYKGPELISQEELDKLKVYIDGMHAAREEIENWEDMKTLRFLNAQTEAFGGMENRLEVLNSELQIAERILRRVGEEEGFSENFKRRAEVVNKLRQSVKDLQDVIELTYLVDMNNVLDTLATNSDLLAGRINILENRLRDLSKTGQGRTPQFEYLAEMMNEMIVAQTIMDNLSSAFDEFFSAVIEGEKNMGEVLSNIMKKLIKDLASYLAKLIIMKAIISAFFPEFAVFGIASKIAPLIGLGGFPGGAEGGIVPPGYPNDTYPAMLSSHEAIIPLDRLQLQPTAVLEGEVRFEIEGDRLVGILRKQGVKNALY